MKELIVKLLEATIDQLKQQELLPSDLNARIMVDKTKDKSHGDLATNLALVNSKPAGHKPRDLAQLIVDNLPNSNLVEKTEIAGPGFINFYLNSQWLASQVEQMAQSKTLGIVQDQHQNVVVDYSAPNVAKEMHVGHIRSTIIGDAIVRVLAALGNHVIRANHIGDWGTQFGMLIANLEDLAKEQGIDPTHISLADLESFYRQAKQRYDSDEQFALRARNYVVRLQGGDEYCHTMWRKLVDITLNHNQQTYDRMGVSLTKQDVMGESLYNDMLAGIVDDLLKRGIAVEDEGATVVFLKEFKNKDGQPMGVIIRKKDGGYLYTTTDIACAKYRYETLKADRVMYFIDSRQHQHLLQAWTIVRKAGYVPESVSLEHHAFGMMLGKDGKPFKTRTGGTVKLRDLLDEAENRAREMIKERSSNLSLEEQEQVARTIAMAAVKYADLSKSRTTDYVFDWDNMLAFNGNTAPYLQYAYARICAIFRKAGVTLQEHQASLELNQEQEEALAQQLIAFNDVVHQVAAKGMPHLLCNYLYDLSGLFMSFYEACPILSADDSVKASRLQLAALTAKVLKQGLALLGINTLERM
ncbi:arginine--tRNA ligase [Celerinatantimonas diazotrophica]|uniref:Arginine--tRNA ligase n=1 Tax=Celerinatantimonas diazotrophica TaxID=412034 RepID=A0A4R1J9M1_9GAMM|nr:arginine--tRNA ligase [Celerinatantimonas diazotrophica]TCK46799.1 arginyl-tRNA synthetase [Celerinatantimonas diazotrophica]CAG9295502.1 Arginine--tRNA ligase [Celerinatantimonas diazotrophica]